MDEIPHFNWHRYSTKDLPELLKQKRLPTALKPINYFLKIHPYFKENRIVGEVKIKIICLETTKDIILHAGDILRVSYNDIKVVLIGDTVADNKKINIPKVSKNSSAQMLVISAAEELQIGAVYEVFFKFTGKFDPSNSHGFLLEDYEGRYGESNFGCTKLFPIHAREVFPCFDEPSLKATFDIVIGHPKDMMALSVMPLNHTEEDPENGNWVLDYFTQSPPIAPFSVSIFVGAFISGDLMEIPTPQGSFGLQFHAKVSLLKRQIKEATLVPYTLRFFGDYVGVGYPLPKLDVSFAKLPSFAMQANALGHLLIDEGIMRVNYVEHIPVFVNLWLHHIVTPEWWSELNLSAFLGSYLSRLSYITITKQEYWTTYGWGDQNCLYHLFGYQNPQEHCYFHLDATYRGQWLFRMLHSALTEKSFRAGLKKFFTDNLYGTYTEDSFWTTIENQAKADGNLPESVSLKEVAKSWLGGDTYNYPVLNVIRNYGQKSADMEQRFFLLEMDVVLTEKEEKFVWWLPIMYVTPEKLDPASIHTVLWMGEKKSTIIDLPDDSSFVIINPTDDGMFLVNYDQHNWNLIAKFLIKSPELLQYQIRRKVLEDALLLNKGGLLDNITTLNITLFLQNETHTTVWLSVCDWLNKLQENCLWTSVQDKLNKYLKHLLLPTYNVKSGGTGNEVPEEELSFDDSMLLSGMRNLLNRAGSQKDIDESHKYVKTLMSTFTVYDEDTGYVLFFPEFMRHKPENNSEEHKKLLKFAESLSGSYFDKCPGYADYIGNFLNGILDEDKAVSMKKWRSIVNLLTSTPIIHNMTFQFFLNHYEELKERLFPFQELWEDFFRNITKRVKTQEGLDKLMKLHEEHKEELGYSLGILKDEIERAQKDVKWVNENVPDLKFWLDQVLPTLEKFQKDKTIQINPVSRC